MNDSTKPPAVGSPTPPNVAAHKSDPAPTDGMPGDGEQETGNAMSGDKIAPVPVVKQSTAAELDDFGLPIRPRPQRRASVSDDDFESADEGDDGAREVSVKPEGHPQVQSEAPLQAHAPVKQVGNEEDQSIEAPVTGKPVASESVEGGAAAAGQDDTVGKVAEGQTKQYASSQDGVGEHARNLEPTDRPLTPPITRRRTDSKGSSRSPAAARKTRSSSTTDDVKELGGVSEWSHQALAPPKEEEEPEVDEELGWQAMPTDTPMDWYDDTGHLVAKGAKDFDDELDLNKGGAGKGYTRVLLDEDAQSATSMDDHTAYLFKNKGGGTNVIDEEEDEDSRDPLAQMQATKDILTEGQRIAYVGVVRLSMEEMRKDLDKMEVTKKFKKEHTNAVESMRMWSQKMMVRLYSHMDISSSEQIMIEQLAEHGIQPSDMTQGLMQNARVKNPMAKKDAQESTEAPEGSKGETQEKGSQDLNSKSPRPSMQHNGIESDNEESAEPPPPYSENEQDHVPEVIDQSTIERQDKIDIDLRWTVLCDLFLVLLSDSIYDSRSRVLLESVGNALQIPWIDICRFEKRITDALEMQEQAAREDWDEAEHVENRRKKALKRKYLMMGLATAGGGLVIGLSAGLLAPAIGAGLAAGFTAIGVSGTGGFLAGVGGAAIITTSSAIAGGSIAVKASHRRMGAVKTFEYRPLHNNKRVNLILTIPGWMTGKVDDVRLPFSTVDPIMGDIYSLHWEPEMLTSMGDTIRIIANEALTQGIQQVLASTFLTALMAGLSAPIILSKLSYLIDNPWSSSLDRAERAGLILADSIIDRHLGVRPITLVGFSLGARVVFSCLKELVNRAAFGLVQNVYLFGSPVVANKEEWLRVRTVVSGRFVNGYASNDWILGYLFRATSGGIQRVAGLAGVEGVPGLENFACTDIVNGHMAYRAAMPRLLREVGWEVESDEFSEIEDPDPENHEARQRELIQEIEEARKAAKEQPEKKQRWWSNKKKAEKKSWELFNEKSAADPNAGKKDDDKEGETFGSVLFDVDAIQRELASEHIEVKQLESTLPPMQLDLNAQTEAEKKRLRLEKDKEKRKSSGWFRSKSYNAAASPSSPSLSTMPTSPNPEKVADKQKEKEAQKDKDKKKAPAGLFDYDEDEDMDPYAHGAPTMTFERPPSPHKDRDAHEPAEGSQTPDRPQLRSTHTTPIAPRERNAWADEDQAEEGEITMQFA